MAPGETLDLDYWRQAALELAAAFERDKQRLSELDGAIGDGDHGVSMASGFRNAAARLHSEQFSDIGALLNMVGTTFVSTVGGVTGIIFGTTFKGAGKGAAGKTKVNTNDLAEMFRCALDGAKATGKASAGDKSMIDALSPAVAALEDAAVSGVSPAEALILAAAAARAGMESTRDMMAKVGRARYQGQNAVGHIDAGSASVALIFETLAEAAAAKK